MIRVPRAVARVCLSLKFQSSSVSKFYENIKDGQLVLKNEAENQKLMAALEALEFSTTEV